MTDYRADIVKRLADLEEAFHAKNMHTTVFRDAAAEIARLREQNRIQADEIAALTELLDARVMAHTAG